MVLKWGVLGSGKIAKDFACSMYTVDGSEIVAGPVIMMKPLLHACCCLSVQGCTRRCHTKHQQPHGSHCDSGCAPSSRALTIVCAWRTVASRKISPQLEEFATAFGDSAPFAYYCTMAACRRLPTSFGMLPAAATPACTTPPANSPCSSAFLSLLRPTMHAGCRAHPSYEELAADAEVEAVYIATIHPTHYALAKLALEAGKHVLVVSSRLSVAAPAVLPLLLTRAWPTENQRPFVGAGEAVCDEPTGGG